MISSGHVLLLWLGTPCNTWSLARRFDGIGPVPLRARPQVGEPAPWITTFEDLTRVRVANSLAELSAMLALCITSVGGFYVIENPWTSMLWLHRPIINVLQYTNAVTAQVHFCKYLLPWKKPTRLSGTLPGLLTLECLCTGVNGKCSFTGKRHVQLTGRSSTGEWLTHIAEPYPLGLCHDIASLVRACLDVEHN